jgi:hypothetical protein
MLVVLLDLVLELRHFLAECLDCIGQQSGGLRHAVRMSASTYLSSQSCTCGECLQTALHVGHAVTTREI